MIEKFQYLAGELGALYVIATSILVVFTLFMYLAAWVMLLGPRRERVMGYDVRRYGSQRSMGLWVLFGAVLLTSLDTLIFRFAGEYLQQSNPLSILNYGNVDLSGAGTNPFLLSMKLLGAYLVFLGYVFIVGGFIKATGKSIFWGFAGGMALMTLGAYMFVYQ